MYIFFKIFFDKNLRLFSINKKNKEKKINEKMNKLRVFINKYFVEINNLELNIKK